MKPTGVVRRVDELGRIVIPIEIRKTLGINIKDPVEIFLQGNSIMLKRHESSCTFCSGTKELTDFHGKYICKACQMEISE